MMIEDILGLDILRDESFVMDRLGDRARLGTLAQLFDRLFLNHVIKRIAFGAAASLNSAVSVLEFKIYAFLGPYLK